MPVAPRIVEGDAPSERCIGCDPETRRYGAVPRARPARPAAARRCGPDRRGPAAAQGDHPCRRDRSPLDRIRALSARVGGGAEERVLGWMRDELTQVSFAGEVRIVRYRVK